MPRRLTSIALALVLALAAAACGGDDDDASTDTTGPGGVTTTRAGSTSDTTVVGTTGVTGGSSTTASGTTGTSGTSGATATTAPPATSKPTAVPGVPAPDPATPGTYRYRQSGSAKVGNGQPSPAKPEGTLRVDAADATKTQIFHRYVDPAGPPSDSVFEFRVDGVFLKRLVIRLAAGGQNFEFTCTFNPPVPSPPWPPTTGATFSGHGECGRFTAEISGRITGVKTVTLDGASVETVVVETTVKTAGQLTSTSNLVDWYSKSHRLPVHSESHQEGTYGPFKYSSDLTADLISGRPT